MKKRTSNHLSEQLLLHVKMEKSLNEMISEMGAITLEQLTSDLQNDNQKKAFWINVYNAWFQILRKVRDIEKTKIYKVKLIKIAGQFFSLDDVEHGILRKYRYKFSLGYLPNFFTSSLIKRLAVSKVDYRIHFALNCGAVSCPPIAFYSAERIEAQLEMATLNFLETETDIREAEKEIHITQLFKWFLGDFGGTSGIRKILKEKLKISSKGFKLIYKPYSWDESLDNYDNSRF